MAITQSALNAALIEHDKWLQKLALIEAEYGGAFRAILDEFTRDIVAVVAARSNGTGPGIATDEQLNQITEDMRQRLADAFAKAAPVYRDSFGAVANGLHGATLETYRLLGPRTAEDLRAAYESFKTTGFNTVYERGYQAWVQSFEQTGGDLLESMRRELVRGKVDGLTQRAIAKRIAANPDFQFKNLPPVSDKYMNVLTMGGKLGENVALENRANAMARDATARASNRLHEAWTTEAGYRYFLNMNPLDSRTTPGCADASRQEAKTVEQWDEWGSKYGVSGRAPRHYNCRSHMFAVPERLRKQDGLPVGVSVETETNRAGNQTLVVAG